ncbi:MAG: hypothetical protein WEB53_16230 [Akkermansiaceae bacterium]
MEFERLETTNGKIYEHVKVRKIEPDGIAIMHEAGMAKVLFENLSQELQTAFGYDPAKAREHRQAEARAAAIAQAAENEMAKNKVLQAADAKLDKADEALRNRVRGMGRMVQVEGSQISDIGVIADIRVMKPVLMSVPGSMIQKDRKWVYDRKEDGVIRNAKGVKAGEMVTFYPNGVRPTTDIRISWEGPAWRIGFVRYKTRQGLLRTCPLFTGSEDDAVKFYKKHGFTQAAVEAVFKAD